MNEKQNCESKFTCQINGNFTASISEVIFLLIQLCNIYVSVAENKRQSSRWSRFFVLEIPVFDIILFPGFFHINDFLLCIYRINLISMSHAKKLIRNCDQFGVLSQITYFNNDEKFQTLYGGILSLILYLLGFSYLLYMLIIWKTYQIPPFYFSQVNFNPDIKFQLNKPLFVFGLVGTLTDEYGKNYLNSINKKGHYYDLHISDELNSVMTPNIPGYPCVVTKNESYLFDPVCVNLQDENQTILKASDDDQTYDINYLIFNCTNDTSEKCLGNNDQQSLLYNTRWKLTLFTQDVDIKTGKIKVIEKHFYYINDQQTLKFTLNVKKAKFIIDKGIIFSNELVVEVVRSIELVKDYANSDQFTFASINYKLDTQEEIIRVTYLKLGDILAQVSSIFQLLLLSGIIMNMLNKRMMNYNIEQALLQIYFPSIKLFKFEFDWKGKIKSIFFKDKILQNKDFEIVKQFRDDRANQLRGKLDSINIVHEISRIQMHLQSKIPIQEYNKIQGLGYKMNLPQNLSEQFLLDDSNHFIDHYDLNVENEKYKIYQTVEILDSTPFRSITEIPTVTERKEQLIQVHSFIEDMDFVPEEIFSIQGHLQINQSPNRSVIQIPIFSQKIQIKPTHNVSKVKIQDHIQEIPEDKLHQSIDLKRMVIL